jgi:NAD(P)-dependent dehydrogenase (short-subunit alcohol dehydrogenase family)
MSAHLDRVVVITGASSGIGRATALRCAARGARVVLGARRGDVLDDVAHDCQRLGGEALIVAGDVADEEMAETLADAAVARFGRIDVWINNAGVYAVGEFEDTPPDVVDRVLDVNLRGAIRGSRAALAQFRAQGGHGTLINGSSLIGGLAGPLVAAYAASKWGIRGFTLALHEELRDEPDMHACVVRPAAIDTPIFRHAANFSGRRVRALTPTYPPEDVAEAILQLFDEPRREVIVGRSGTALAALHAVLPGIVDRVFAERSARNHFGDGPAGSTRGNLDEPDPVWTSASGQWPRHRRTAMVAVLPAAAAGVVAAALLRR